MHHTRDHQCRRAAAYLSELLSIGQPHWPVPTHLYELPTEGEPIPTSPPSPQPTNHEMMSGQNIEETTTNLSRIGISVGPDTTGPTAPLPKPLEGLRECYRGSSLILFSPPFPLYFEQEEDGASEIHKAPLVEDSFSFLSLHAWVESQRTGFGRRVGTGELHFEDTFSLWKRAREGRDIPTGMGGGILAPR